MPRLKDLPDQVLSRIDRDADYGALHPLLSGRVNVELILEQWDQLVRLAASLKDRLTPPSLVRCSLFGERQYLAEQQGKR